MPTLLVTGRSGQLGRTLEQVITLPSGWNAVFTGRQELDLGQTDTLAAQLAEIGPDFVINTAAYTQVDPAESDQETAFRINDDAVGVIARYCAEHDVPVIHFSSDYVYDNELNRPLEEGDPKTPKGVYAKSKLAGEQKLALQGGVHYIIRTSWVYAPYGQNFVHSMLRLADQHQRLTIVCDQIGAPTYTFDLARVCQIIFNRYVEDDPISAGIYNYANSGVCSWYDFAKAIFEMEEINVSVQPIPTTSFPRPAPRPPYSVMNLFKIRRTLGIDIPHWRNSLKDCLERRKQMNS